MDEVSRFGCCAPPTTTITDRALHHKGTRKSSCSLAHEPTRATTELLFTFTNKKAEAVCLCRRKVAVFTIEIFKQILPHGETQGRIRYQSKQHANRCGGQVSVAYTNNSPKDHTEGQLYACLSKLQPTLPLFYASGDGV